MALCFLLLQALRGDAHLAHFASWMTVITLIFNDAYHDAEAELTDDSEIDGDRELFASMLSVGFERRDRCCGRDERLDSSLDARVLPVSDSDAESSLAALDTSRWLLGYRFWLRECCCCCVM